MKLEQFINYTNEVLMALGEQLQDIGRMAWQNRQALDWMLAETGGVCYMYGDQCCACIPNNTTRGGTFYLAMSKIRVLRQELKNNSGKEGGSWD